jgi:hypothetical protein
LVGSAVVVSVTAVSVWVRPKVKPPKVLRSPIEKVAPLRPLPAVKRLYEPAARPGRPVRLTMTLLAAVAVPVVTMRS